MTVCPSCGHAFHPQACLPVPTEPPVGTWVKDRFGGTHVRIEDSDGNIGWSASPTGFYAFGKWAPMWESRGPLVECGPWGAELPEPHDFVPNDIEQLRWAKCETCGQPEGHMVHTELVDTEAAPAANAGLWS